VNDQDSVLREYYSGRRLGVDRIRAIDAALRRRRRIGFVAGATTLAAVASLAVAVIAWLGGEPDGSPTQRMVAEIARNHVEPGSLAVESSRYGVVQEALRDLDFPVRPGRDDLEAVFGLVGGRYCTVLGSRAAQLHLVHRESGITHTLYVVRVTDELVDVSPGSYRHDGVGVEVWLDGELLYGLAKGG